MIEARRAAFILVAGLVLGSIVALGGGLVGGLVDSGSRRVDAVLYGPFLILLPAVAYAIAIVFLRSATGRLTSADREKPDQLVRAGKLLTSARTAVLVGLIPNGFFGLFGGLALIGAADTFDTGAALSILAGIGAEWVFLAAAIVAMEWIGSSRRLTPAWVSADGHWWWDGQSWQPVPASTGGTVRETIQFLESAVQAQPATPRQAVVAYSRPMNPLAVVSAMAAILSWLVCPFIGAITAVVTGHIALAQIRKTPAGGRVWALTGVILGYLNLGFFGVLGILMVSSAFQNRS